MNWEIVKYKKKCAECLVYVRYCIIKRIFRVLLSEKLILLKLD